MSLRTLLLLALLASALAAVVELPAAWLAHSINDLCATRCRLSNTEGTLWRGSSDIYFRDGLSGPWQLAQRLSWRLEGSALARGRLAIALDQGNVRTGSAAVRLEVGARGVELAVRQFSLPAGLVLSNLGRGIPASGWGGQLYVEDSRASSDFADFAGGWQGKGVLRWRAARTALLENIVLGDYRLDWTRASREALHGTLSSTDAVLDLQGEISVAGDGRLRFAGSAEIAREHRASLEKYLRAVGSPSPGVPGKYLLNLPNSQRF